MRNEWQIYRKQLRRNLKGYAYAMGVSLVFYLFAIPGLHGAREHLQYFLIALMYSTVIFTWIWCLYALQWALLAGRKNSTFHLSRPAHFLLGATGTAFGLLNALYLQAWIEGRAFQMADFWPALLVGLFIAAAFQFHHAYKRSSQENLELKATKAESDLHVLRNQMQPHFLFNSLNSLASMIEQNPASAGEATQKLADLYRLILECSQSQLSSLEKELHVARLYLEIEQVRFGDRLRCELPRLTPEFREKKVPSLLIQTLVENAVKHGISPALEGGFVRVNAESGAKGLRIEILNSGSPLRSLSGGTGLGNSRERLDLLFGPRHELSLRETASGHTSASFWIPEEE
jgi:hypothetical protein